MLAAHWGQNGTGPSAAKPWLGVRHQAIRRHQALIFLAKGGRWCLALESLLQQPDNLLVDAAKMAVAHDNNPIIWLGPLGELSG